MASTKRSLLLLLLVCLSLFTIAKAGKSAVKASAFVSTYNELSEPDEVKLLSQLTEAFFKESWPQTRESYVSHIEQQAKTTGITLQPTEVPILADKLAALLNKIKVESVPIEGTAAASKPVTTATPIPNPTVATNPQAPIGTPSSLPFDPTKVLGYPVNATNAGMIYDSITKNAKQQCTNAALPIRCAMIKTVQDIETFRNQPTPPPAEIMAELHRFMDQDFQEAEKIIADQMSKGFEQDQNKHETQVKNVKNRIEEAQKILGQIKDETLNLIVDQKKRVEALQKDINDQKYFLDELNKILNKPPVAASNPIPLPEVKTQPTPMSTSQGSSPIYAATVVKQSGSQLGRVGSSVLSEENADPIALTSSPVAQQPTPVYTGVQQAPIQQAVLLNTVAGQPVQGSTSATTTVTTTTVPGQSGSVSITSQVVGGTKATTTTDKPATTTQPASTSSGSSQPKDDPNIFVRFWRWLTSAFSSSKQTTTGSGISGHVVLNQRLDN